MALKCPFCGYVWDPRRVNPASCPKCKRYETADKLFVEVEQQVRLNRRKPIEITVSEAPSGSYYLCYACPTEDKNRAVVKLDGHHYCRVCLMDKIAEIAYEPK